jgi:hypothetical protein
MTDPKYSSSALWSWLPNTACHSPAKNCARQCATVVGNGTNNGRLNFDGWLPIRIWPVAEQWQVDWCWFADTTASAFFRDAVEEALRLPFNQAFRRQTPLSVLTEWQAQSPGLAPSAFILHASRCGSTLISQMLARLDDHIVVSSPPLDALLRGELPEAERRAAISGLLSAYGQRRRGIEQRLVIKLDAWNIGEWPLLQACFPDTPWLFRVSRSAGNRRIARASPGDAHGAGDAGDCVLDDGLPFTGSEDFIARRWDTCWRRRICTAVRVTDCW